MPKKMLISVDADENRVAILQDGRLENLEIETLNNEQVKGNIYKGVVHRLEPSLHAAFVDFGSEKQGFLPFAEIHPHLINGDSDKRVTITDVLQPKQELLVQVVRDEIGNKGATLSTYVSIPGRYLVLIPDSEKTGVSRRISDQERSRLKDIVADMQLPEGFGLIIRTAGSDRSEAELQKDMAYLTKMWDVIDRRYKDHKGPGLIFEERSLGIRAIRDYFGDEFDEVWLDDAEAHKEVLDFVSLIMPQYKDAVKLYRGTIPLFIKHGVEDQIEEVFSRKVPLPSGGSIVIDTTEALVAIDVNSGRSKGDDIEETAYLANMEAAREIARQVIIRDLGGIIVVDFIDMRDRKRMRDVENALRDAFKNDKARRKFSRISEFGLLEMSRQRLKSTLMRSSFERCEQCDGQGVFRAPESAGMYLLRRIREVAGAAKIHQVVVKAPIPIANFLVNRKRRELHALEVERQTLVEVYSDESLPPTQAVIEYIEHRGKARPKQTIQTIDLVRSEIVKREGEPIRRGDVIFREIPKSVDFAEVYKDIEEEHGPTPMPAPAAAAVPPTPPPAPPAPRTFVVPTPPPRPSQKVSWWQRLFGVRADDYSYGETPAPQPVPIAVPASVPATPPPVAVAQPEPPKTQPTHPRSPENRHQQSDHGGRRPRHAPQAAAPASAVKPPQIRQKDDDSGDADAQNRRRRRRGRRRPDGNDGAPNPSENNVSAGTTESGPPGRAAQRDGGDSEGSGDRGNRRSRRPRRPPRNRQDEAPGGNAEGTARGEHRGNQENGQTHQNRQTSADTGGSEQRPPQLPPKPRPAVQTAPPPLPVDPKNKFVVDLRVSNKKEGE